MNKLPLVVDVPIKTLPFYSHPLGVLLAAEIDVEFLLLNQFLNIYAFANYIWADDTYFADWDCFDVKTMTATDFQAHDKFNVISLIEREIQAGWYLSVFINEYYLPFSIAYQKANLYHEIFVSGYTENEFFVEGYDRNGNYDQRILDKRILETAFLSVPQSGLRILGYRLKKGFLTPHISKEQVLQRICSYYNCLSDCLPPSRFYHFGRKTYDYLLGDIDSHLNGKSNILESRIFHKYRMLLEHKQCMVKALAFLDVDTELRKQYETVLQLAERSFFVTMKLSVVLTEKKILQLQQSLVEMRSVEERVLSLILAHQ